jgi:Protein of unknown function (DUF3726)
MTWSLNELEAETKKAIRGAGLSWGLSEEGGKAVRWLAAHGVDPLPALADVLDRHERIASTPDLTETGRWTAGAPICPIALGVTLCDHADRLAAKACFAGPVARPLLLAPFVAAAARILGRPLQLEADGRKIMLDERGDPSGDLSMLDASDAEEIRCAMIADRPSISQVKAASTHGIETDAPSWTLLASYVHRTYVPASERSRREGAGAGLIDND